jgi:hypothetical protein
VDFKQPVDPQADDEDHEWSVHLRGKSATKDLCHREFPDVVGDAPCDGGSRETVCDPRRRCGRRNAAALAIAAVKISCPR